MSAILSATTVCAQDVDYSQGVFIVNEDWYGHQNSTVNYILPDDPNGDYWHYRVIQTENPGKELGCTNQYGQIWKGRFYLIAKQERDPGASVTGGRITVADAKTMKVLRQHELIDPSGKQCDGRGFLGIDDHKGYISSSNGIWVFDLDRMEVVKQIPGSANPNVGQGGDLPNDNPGSSLYYGQCGSMVMSAGKVFAAHQSAGILVIDPLSDEVTDVLTFSQISETAAPGSVVLAKDGSVWASVAKDAKGSGATLPYIVRIDPATLQMTVHSLPDGISAPANSWYAWTPDGFCASAQRNALYWNGGKNSWFSQSQIFRYDIDTDSYEKIIDLKEEGEGWNLYGCSMRLHPLTDELYMSLFVKFASTTYTLRRCDYRGNTIKDYPMIANYWFPSLPVFPQAAGADGVENVTVDRISSDDIRYYDLQGRYVGNSPDGLRGLYIRSDGRTTSKIRL